MSRIYRMAIGRGGMVMPGRGRGAERRGLWRRVGIIAGLALAGGLLASGPGVAGADQPLPQPLTHRTMNFVQEALTANADGTTGEAAYKNPSSPICSTAPSNAANVNTDCEGLAPHNETSIAVDPGNANHLVGSANDYQLFLTSGGTVVETAFSRAHVSWDGGRSWTTYPIDDSGYAATGDPAVAFDGAGNAYLATLGFLWSQGQGLGTNPDILVAHSSDGGRTWSGPVRVAAGSGSWISVGIFNDKEYLTAWGKGNAIVTWTRFEDGQLGSYIRSPIYASVTHDGGVTWTPPQEISGSAPFCIGAQGGNACDQDQASIPVVDASGRIYVAFLNYAAPASDFTGNDQYLVVQVDPVTGARIGGPWRVATLVDSLLDYPVNVDGRSTYQDSQFRTWSAGNLAADPTTPGHLAIAWSDMRNSTPNPNTTDPYAWTTNSDVVVSESLDGGRTWSPPVAIQLAGDQFMPWAAFDASGCLRIGFFDRSVDPANHSYGYTVATRKKGGPLAFTLTTLTTALSDPTRNDRWFAGRTVNPAYPHATTFLGDYSGIAPRPGGGIVAYWTDMRNLVTFTTRTGWGEDAVVALAR